MADNTAFNEQDYIFINDEVGEILFDGKFADQPVYLDCEKNFMSQIAEKVGMSEEELSPYIFELCAVQLSTNGSNPFIFLVAKNKKWIDSKYSGYPPTLLFLCALSLIAENMNADTKMSVTNYYGRLVEAFKLPHPHIWKERISQTFNTTVQLWEDLNYWLEQIHEHKLGIPTARPILPHLRNISYPMSQALVRKGDRKAIKQYFLERSISREDASDPDYIAGFLGQWLSSSSSTKYLQRLWSERALRRIIVDSAIEVLNEVENHSHDRSQAGLVRKRLILRIRCRNFPKKSVSMFFETPRNKIKDQTIALEHSIDGNARETMTDLKLSPSDKFDIFTLGPPSSIVLKTILTKATRLTSAKLKIEFIFTPRPILALKKEASGNYEQIDRPSLFSEYVVLAKKREKERVVKFLDRFANSHWQIKEVMQGLPDGFVLFEKVVFVKAVDDDEVGNTDSLFWIRPSDDLVTLQVNGGLKLGSNNYHKASDLDFLFQSTNPEETILISDNSAMEIGEEDYEYTFQTRGNIGAFCLKDLLSSTATGFFTISSKEKPHSFPSYKLRLSSASRPDKHQYPPAGGYHLAPIEIFGYLSYADRDSDKMCLQGLVQPKDLRSVPTQSNAAIYHQFIDTLSDEELPESEDQTYRELEDIDPDSSQSCFERGHHVNVFRPEDRSDRESESTCKDCGENRIWAPKKRGRKSNANSNWENRSLRQTISLPKSHEKNLNAEDLKYSSDDIFDALCYLQSTTFTKFKDMCHEASSNSLLPFKLLDELETLGHIDVELGLRDLKPLKLHVAPPTLLNIGDTLVLAGFRNEALLSQLSQILGVPITARNSDDPFSITQYRFRNDSKALRSASFGAVKDYFERSIKLSLDFGAIVSQGLPNLNAQFYNTLPQTSIDTRSGCEKFTVNTGTCRWEATDTIRAVGAYRTDWPTRSYFLRLPSDDLVAATYPIAKIYAANREGVLLHRYDREAKVFVSKIGCDLPTIVKRLLGAYSGRLPEQQEGCNLYQDIPAEIGQTIIEKLYAPLEL
jgi:hypothetical protein